MTNFVVYMTIEYDDSEICRSISTHTVDAISEWIMKYVTHCVFIYIKDET